MATETPERPKFVDRILPQSRREEIFQKRVEIASTILLAIATVATAWSGYQSARWGGEQTDHSSRATTAIIRSGHFANLAEQKISLQATLFSQWVAAVGTNNQALATFMLTRFPEPLKTATEAWQKTEPLTNPNAPATPFEMPEYSIPETAQAQQWEEVSVTEQAAAQEASDISDRYLLFTIVFASVLFFAGVSGKFGWQPLDLTNLILGILVLVIALVILLRLPIL